MYADPEADLSNGNQHADDMASEASNDEQLQPRRLDRVRSHWTDLVANADNVAALKLQDDRVADVARDSICMVEYHAIMVNAFPESEDSEGGKHGLYSETLLLSAKNELEIYKRIKYEFLYRKALWYHVRTHPAAHCLYCKLISILST